MTLAIEFGSKQRGDSGTFSDRDLLLLGSDWCQLRQEAELKTRAGYSVSSLPLSTATYLTQRGSLFFKHIIDEGLVVSGPKEEYVQLASQWKPKRDYNDEIEETLDVMEVLNYIPRTRSACTAAVDILVSSMRSILIRMLANRGEYVFSWTRVFSCAQRYGIIGTHAASLFLNARGLKNMYRRRMLRYSDPAFLEELIGHASIVLNRRWVYRFSSRAVTSTLPERYADGTYKQLRALELLCAEYDFDPSLDEFMALVRNPSYFAANGMKRPS